MANARLVCNCGKTRFTPTTDNGTPLMRCNSCGAEHIRVNKWKRWIRIGYVDLEIGHWKTGGNDNEKL